MKRGTDWGAIAGVVLALSWAGCGETKAPIRALTELGVDDGASAGEATTALVTGEDEVTLELSTGAAVKVPVGAVEKDITLGLSRPPDEKALKLVQSLDSVKKIASAPYVLTPHGTKFKTRVEVALPVAEGRDGKKLKVVWLEDEEDTDWEDLGTPVVAQGKAKTRVEHFSVLLLVEDEAAGPGPGGSDGESDAGTGTTLDAGHAGGRDAGTRGEPDAGKGEDLDANTGKPDASSGNPDASGGDKLDGGSDTDGGHEPAPVPPTFNLLVGRGSAGLIDLVAGADFASLESGNFSSGGNGGLARVEGYFGGELGYLRVGGGTGVRMFHDLVGRTNDDDDGFNDQRDRQFGGWHLNDPRGAVFVAKPSWIVVADHSDATIKVFSSAAAGDAPPLFELGIGEGRSVWGVEYAYDCLYATLTDGSVAAYDSFVASGPVDRAQPSRVFRAQTPHASRTSYRGIKYYWPTLVVSDVGALDEGEHADFASDGSILFFDHPHELEGDVVPSKVIAGAATGLGNPVDIHLVHYSNYEPTQQYSTLYVADDANDRLSAWVDVFEAALGDVPPYMSASVEAPQTLSGAEYVGAWSAAGPNYETLLVAQNPGVDGASLHPGNFRVQYHTTPGAPPDGALDTFAGSDPTTSAETTHLLESMALDALGNAWLTYSATSAATTPGGGIMVIHDIGARQGDEVDFVARDREIAGPNTGLVDPKGIAVRNELVIVADYGAADLKVFSVHAAGDVSPLATISDIGDAASVWGVAMSWSTLYVSTTDGRVLAYDDFSLELAQSGPSRVITYAGGRDARGLSYYGGSLFVGDVGETGIATDGALHRIDDADFADGAVTPDWTVTGTNSNLGDPVGLALADAQAVYVADSATQQVSMFLSPLSPTGTDDLMPYQAVTLQGPESLLMLPRSQF